MSTRRTISGALLDVLQTVDYAALLPLIARLPLPLGYRLAGLRGRINARTLRDWRSVYMGTRHIARQATLGYQMLYPDLGEAEIKELVRQRYRAESGEEFDAALLGAHRLDELHCSVYPEGWLDTCRASERGLLLMTPHFDRFTAGIAFLGLLGMTVNAMSTAADDDSINSALHEHYKRKYAGTEVYTHGGRVLHMQFGMKPFYRMLERGECLVILGDVPASSTTNSAAAPMFLGARRRMSGGALRMARKTGSRFGSFVCRHEGGRNYRIDGSPIVEASDPDALDVAYGFLSEQILADPGLWWASDGLPAMPVEVEEP